MPDAKPLSQAMITFAEGISLGLPKREAAIRAGYSERSAHVAASRLLKNAKVLALIRGTAKKAAKATGITVQRVLQELEPLAFSNIGDFLKLLPNGGVVLDWSKVPEGAMRAVSEITQEEYLEGKGDDARLVRRTKFKLHSKIAALEMLAKHLLMYPTRKVEVPGRTDGQDFDRSIWQQVAATREGRLRLVELARYIEVVGPGDAGWVREDSLEGALDPAAAPGPPE